MKKIFTTLLLAIGGTSLFSQAAPELLYYKFDGTGTSVPNMALTPPVGTNTATLMGSLTQGPTGQCQGAVIGSGNASSTDYVNTGYATNLTGTSWTISMWTKDITASSTLFYIFGDASANSFRCFTNGVAGPNNWILRGGGMTDIYVNGGATVAPHVTTFVYDITMNTVQAYLDGVLVSTVAQGGLSITGAGPFKVIGYGSNVGAPSGGKLDEFRMYNRALTATEVARLVNPPDVYSAFSVTACGSFTLPSGNATYTTSGVYQDTIPAIYNCGDSIMTITATVNPLPTVSLGADATACGSYTLDAQNAGSTYLWSDASTNQTLTVTATGYYSVTVTDMNGCSNADTMMATINPLPTVSLGADATACGSLTLDAQNAGDTYLWSDASTNQTLTVTATGYYSVTVTDMNGCSNADTMMATINPLPTVSLGADATACGSLTLDAQNQGDTYLWSDASTNQMLTVTATGIYAVTVTDANGCSNADTMMATINPLPIVSLGADATACGSLILDAQNAGSTYLWSDASTNQTLTVTTTGNYAVTVTDANGCSNADTMMATINPLPTVSLGPDASGLCGSIILDALNQGSSYMWNDGSTNQTLVVTSNGIYSVLVTDANGCSNSDTIMLGINPLPTVTATAASNTVCLNDAPVVLTGAPAGGTWTGPGVTASSFSPMSAGVGTQTTVYTYTDGNGCSNSDSAVITVNSCVGVEEEALLNGINIYPNPNNGVFTVVVNANVGDLKIVITDMQGRVVYSSNENNVNAGYTQQINLQSEAAGIYLMQISGNGQQRMLKVSVQK